VSDDFRFWISTLKGISRVPIVDLKDFAAGKSDSWSHTDFGTEDGMRSMGCSEGTQSTGVKDHLGNLWFASRAGILRVDPIKVSRGIPPLQVVIDSVSADLVPVDPVRGGSVLPGKNVLEFHYTAPSFRDPNKVQFRYRLAPLDRNWNAAGARRSVYYTNLPPGKYRFQVQVRNIDETWNESGASVEINLRARFYQMLWFRLFCFLILISAVTSLYVIRKRQLAAQMQQRLEERLADRTRIAQELHDTFLQDIVGLVFNIELASNELPSQPGDAKGRLQGVLDQLRQTVAAGRRALTDLRSPNISYGDLANALLRLGEQVRSEMGPVVGVHIEGNIGWLPPLIGDEVFQVSREALFNAIRHARANTIELTLNCTENAITLRILDDGCGIEPEVLRRGRPGHFGLQGMKERAERINGHFRCHSSEGSGTEISLRVPLPASRAKRSPVGLLHSLAGWFFRRNEKNDEGQIG
jgi:signal transduction histidine kinase